MQGASSVKKNGWAEGYVAPAQSLHAELLAASSCQDLNSPLSSVAAYEEKIEYLLARQLAVLLAQ